jgi:hypothetical protein
LAPEVGSPVFNFNYSKFAFQDLHEEVAATTSWLQKTRINSLRFIFY